MSEEEIERIMRIFVERGNVFVNRELNVIELGSEVYPIDSYLEGFAQRIEKIQEEAALRELDGEDWG